jgi:hypothetical protein
MFLHRHNLGGARGANAPAIFFIPKNSLCGYCVQEGKYKIEIFSKRLFWWCKERKNEKPAFYGTQNSGESPVCKGRKALESPPQCH